jgi:uncharacterized protein (TIGR02145 family)
MYKSFFRISILIASVAIVFNACSKDDDNVTSSGNTTNGKTTAVFNSSITYGTMTDQDGNVYKTVTIGTQTWMAENLRTTKYNDGTDIPNVTVADEWDDLTTSAYCNYNNTTNIDTIATYGRLYNWHTVNTGKLCPTGWHVSTHAEWTTLNTYLGSEVGGKLKEADTLHWNSTNIGATNETGFTALPGGWRTDGNGSFLGIGEYGWWWSATELETNNAWDRGMKNNSSGVLRDANNKAMGFSVRCVRD